MLRSYLAGSLNGFCRTTLRTAPFRRQRVQTHIVLCVPFTDETFTRCRFGLNLRRVIPVIFVPTPPRYLALPRVSTAFPTWVPFPHTSQTRDIEFFPSCQCCTASG